MSFYKDVHYYFWFLRVGTWLSEHKHNYYPNFREQYRHPHQTRLLEELPMMKTLEEEERPTYFQRMSRDSGLLGLSVLHRLYSLYGFDVLRDTVFDAMHLLPLNVVKNHIERWITQGYLDKKDLNTNLSKMRGLLVINDKMFSVSCEEMAEVVNFSSQNNKSFC